MGVVELNRNPENYFADVEQSAFTPANVVPGIGFSPDRLLQGRLFSYGDTQRYRLGINHHQIPVNAPLNPVHAPYHRDGSMRADGNLGGTVNYEPNRFGAFAQDPSVNEPPLAVGAIERYDHRADDDYYSHARALFRLFTDGERERLFGNIARHIDDVPEEIVARQLEHFHRADPAYAQGVAKRSRRFASRRKPRRSNARASTRRQRAGRRRRNHRLKENDHDTGADGNRTGHIPDRSDEPQRVARRARRARFRDRRDRLWRDRRGGDARRRVTGARCVAATRRNALGAPPRKEARTFLR